MSAHETFYVILGLLTIVPAVWPNRRLFAGGLGLSALEAFYYVVALAALLVGWYFNFQYMRSYGDQVGWWHWTTLLFVNPASASGGQDLIFANVVLMLPWLVMAGRRSGLRHAWWFFVMSIFTSYAFAFALFLAIDERQWRSRTAAAA
ncbi:MAG TPA: DUF2834 domain-containing protein [Solimonas sp.]|nr:DUF2834 domain-containing protein [Solimonas sp.]